jgi:phage head maturation protease
MERVKKCFEVKAQSAELQENRIRVVPSVMGTMDRGGDVIFPGAFRKVAKQFLADGFVADTHGWSMADVIAMPLSLAEEGNLLTSEAEFHSTPDAQNIRTKVKERIDHKLSVGASIGFWIAKDGRAWFDNGAALLKYAEEIGADMKLFDTKGIKAWDEWCRAITLVEELNEYSIVPVPMMPLAGVMDAKAMDDIRTERDVEEALRDAGFTRGAAKVLIARCKGLEPDAPRDNQADTSQRDAAAEWEALQTQYQRLRARTHYLTQSV